MISLRDHGLMERAELQITGDYTTQRLIGHVQRRLGSRGDGWRGGGRGGRWSRLSAHGDGPRVWRATGLMQALTPTVLAMIGRNLIEWGESLHFLKYRMGPRGAEFYLCPAQHSVDGVTAEPIQKSGSWTPH